MKISPPSYPCLIRNHHYGPRLISSEATSCTAPRGGGATWEGRIEQGAGGERGSPCDRITRAIEFARETTRRVTRVCVHGGSFEKTVMCFGGVDRKRERERERESARRSDISGDPGIN
jgi:hypothetical protein